MFVYQCNPDEIRIVKSSLGQGLSDYEIARRTNVSRSTIQRWRTRGVPRRTNRKIEHAWRPAEPHIYSYMLGIYLGDGYVARASAPSPVLEISLDPKYPRIVDECSASIWRLVGARAAASRRKTPRGEAIRLVATSHLWLSVFPQHGLGKKHEREISLTSWQQAAVDRFPDQFVRGLIHSDGCRAVNHRQSVALLDAIVGPKS